MSYYENFLLYGRHLSGGLNLMNYVVDDVMFDNINGSNNINNSSNSSNNNNGNNNFGLLPIFAQRCNNNRY